MKRQLIITKRPTIILSQIALMMIFAFHNLFVVSAQTGDFQQETTATIIPSPTPTVTLAGNEPTFSWLSTPPESKYLASSRSLAFLAGEMIFHGLVDASSCADNGLVNETTASPCGEAVARNAVILWQNQFDADVLDSSIQAGVPSFMLKNIIAQESQFWPANFPTVYGYPEVGLGHVTEMGADTLLRWDNDFYAGFCTDVYSSNTCKKPYIYLPRDQQVTLRGAIMQGLDADCGGCLGGVDLPSARESIYLIGKVVHANYNYVEWMLGNITSRSVSKTFELTDLWRFTLTSYNAGPGCLRSAIYQTQKNGGKLTWKDVSKNFDKGCEGAVDYVDAVTNVYQADSQALEVALSDTSKASQLVLTSMGLGTPTLVSTVSEQPLPSTPTPESTPTSLSPADTPTATLLADETVTPVPPSATPVPSATPTIEPTPTSPAPVSSTPESPNTNEIVVKFNSLVPSFIANAIVNNAGGQVESQVDALDLIVIEVAPEQTSQILEELQNNLFVEYAEPNYTLGVLYTPNDPGYVNQNYLADMQIPQAWDISRGQGVVVAVIDTGVDVTHPELASNVWTNAGEQGLDVNGNDKRANGIDDDNNGYVDDWQGWNFVDNGNNVTDVNGHGTHGAGIIAAQIDNEEGIAGIAPSAQIMPLKALDDNGYGTYAQVAEAIIYAVDNGAQVINLGFGGTANSEALLAAVDYAYTRNVMVIAAAGNTGTNAVFYPAAYDNVIAVSALDNNLTIASFSTFNNYMDLAAPGVGIYSTQPGGYTVKSGTSMSAAQVSGVAALLASQPQFATVSEIRNALLSGAQDLGFPGWDEFYGDGLVQAVSSLNYAPVGTPTATYTLPAVTNTPVSVPTDTVNIMAISALQAWTNVYHGTADTQTISYTIPAGSNTNRVLVVAIASSQTAVGARTVTLTYGNQALTPVNGDMAMTTVRQHTQLYYLNEAGIDAAANTNLAFTISGGTTRVNDVFVAVFDGVDQTTPITNSQTYSSGVTAVGNFSFAAPLTVNAGDQAVEIVSSLRSGNTNPRTITYATNWTMANEQTYGVTDGVRNGVANRAIPGTNATDPSTTTFSGNALASMTGMSLKPAVAPTLTSPTATSILDTSATLGANITSDGGSAITARGTCWNTTTPVVNVGGVGNNCTVASGTATGIFTQARTGLPAGTKIYYKAYATNSIGTSYSPEGSFYTEPATQASGMNFTAVSLNSMTINWTRGSGSGVIVLVKATSAITGVPVDGTYTTYIANTTYGSGTLITDAYVVYKGTGTNVTITGLTSSTAYYVAVYEFAGTMDTAGVDQGTNYMGTPATGNQTTTAGGNTPPTVSISSPPNGSSFPQGTSITFSGTANDAQDGDIKANLSWSSSIDGAIGSGASFFKSNLSVGTHVVTASVTDSGGLTGSASINVTITAPANTPPTVIITAPANGSSFVQGTSVTFTGTANDPQDGDIKAGLVWTSNRDGNLGSGATFNKSNLSVGTHTITASVTDSGGLTASASITITITLGPVAPFASPDYYNTPRNTNLVVAAPGLLSNDSDANGDAITAFKDTDPASGTISVFNPNGSFTYIPAANFVGTVTFTYHARDAGGLNSNVVTVTIYVSTPHGPYGAMTDECARCHRTHTADTNRLIEYPTSPLTSNAFCLSCHSAGPVIVSTHSNQDKPGTQEPFELLCIQCHEPHGSANLSNVRSLVRVQQNPAVITTGPVVFTAQTGANSFDELPADGSSVDDVCVTCHINAARPGAGTNLGHSGGLNHVGGIDQRGTNCITCHPHSADNGAGAAATRDGFMPAGGSCTGCHANAQNDGNGVPAGGRVAIVGMFSMNSHHVKGVLVDADCQVCHSQTTHADGFVDLINGDTGVVIRESAAGAFRTATMTAGDNTNLTTFCQSCHDGNGATRLATPLTPFSGGVNPLRVSTHSNNTFTPGTRAEAVFQSGCSQCHASHGSSNLSLVDTTILVRTVNFTTGPVTFTALTGTNSFDDGVSAVSGRICVTCHANANNPGTPMVNHTGGAAHIGGSSYVGKNCTLCHPHEKDANSTTLDGFMPLGSTCMDCHKQAIGTRRQIVDSNGNGTGTGGDFKRASHHVSTASGIPAVTDCTLCHDQSQHTGGVVRLKNADTPATVYALDGTGDDADYENFCISCHSSTAPLGANGDTTPFSDNTGTVIAVNSASWTSASHAAYKSASFEGSCRDCHSNGHGSNKVSQLSLRLLTNDFAKTSDGDDDPLNQEEQFCYTCHDADGPAARNVYATYGALPTNWANRNIGTNNLPNLNDRHDITTTDQTRSGSKIECADCHNPHADNATTKIIADPDPGDGRLPSTANAYFTGDNFQSRWCLDCHDKTYPTGVIDGHLDANGNPDGLVNVMALWDGLTNGDDTHGARNGNVGSIPADGNWTTNITMQCFDCHTFHVSNVSGVVPTLGGNTNLFQLKPVLYSRNGLTALTTKAPGTYNGTFNYENSQANPFVSDQVDGYAYCNACHDGTQMQSGADNCSRCHMHGSRY